MKRFAIGLGCAVGGYALGAFAGFFIIQWLSSNVHDRSVEAAMTSAFVFGPLGAVAGFVVGFVLAGRLSRRRQLAGPAAK
jgi:membrane associated rhomboid family serine protease